MQLLKDRILKDGIVKPGNILKVDSFLNHQMDITLINEIGKEACAKYLRIWNWMRPVNTSRMISTGMRQISCIKMPRMPKA